MRFLPVRGFLRKFWPVIPALLIYAGLAYLFDFTQDDAYISYRYVANYLNGHGLVYNIGERIEGFTNFGWTIYMLFWGVLGCGYIALSKITGFLAGAGLICVTGLLTRLIFGEKEKWLLLVTTLLVGLNQSLAYWSPAGLETAAFAFFALLSLYWYLRRNWLLIFGLLMAVWIRPEGAVVTGIIILVEIIRTRRFPRFTLTCAAMAFVLSLPYVGFKLFYYGGIIPNPFYAKTSFTPDQILSGLEYAGRFFGHYGFWGAGLIIPLLFYRRLDERVRAIWLFTVIYLVYIVVIGGDVLKVHRFFLPLFGPSAVLLVYSLWLLAGRFTPAHRRLSVLVVSVPLLVLTYFLPHSFVAQYNNSEINFTIKMQYKAEQMLKADSTNFSVAVPTIGIFGYELLGHEVIDMVGLTDSTIARYSEEPIPGMTTTWKERKHNSRYLLEKAPDYIVFSTGIKPSAPAERALLLYEPFMNSYRTVGWYYVNPLTHGRGVLISSFKKVRPVEGELVPTYPVEYVQYYKTGLDYLSQGNHRMAVIYYDSAMHVSPKPYFIYLVYHRAFSMMVLRQFDQSYPVMETVLARDSTVYEAHANLYRLAVYMGDQRKIEIHRRWLKKLVPWYYPRVEANARELIRQSGRRP